jgi:rubrerythrin
VDAAFFGEDGGCAAFVRLPCGVPASLPGTLCYPDVDLCTAACPTAFFFACEYPAPSCADGGLLPDADVFIECNTCLGNIGRRPVGWEGPGASPKGSPLGRFLARSATLEEASVAAFAELHARLRAFGAPRRLRAAARRAAGDERRHARMTAALARRHGGLPAPPPPAVTVDLAFEAFAMENAVEGCVGETFGALVALHQAARAEDPQIAAAMGAIAADEIRHAALAWSIHEWALPRLSSRARARVCALQEGALQRLRRGTASAPPEVARLAGLPRGATEQTLARHLAQALFEASR